MRGRCSKSNREGKHRRMGKPRRIARQAIAQAAEIQLPLSVEWLAKWLSGAGKTLWIVTDGAYAKRPFLARARAAEATVVSRRPAVG